MSVWQKVKALEEENRDLQVTVVTLETELAEDSHLLNSFDAAAATLPEGTTWLVLFHQFPADSLRASLRRIIAEYDNRTIQEAP